MVEVLGVWLEQPPDAPGSAEGMVPPALITTEEVLVGLPRIPELEARHGNGDLIRALTILGIAGPFKVTSPWELEDETGRHLINAGGYAALPFGEMYPPLVDFVRRYLSENSAMSLPQQSASAWRAALETNLVSLLAQEAPSHADSQVFFSKQRGPRRSRRPSSLPKRRGPAQLTSSTSQGAITAKPRVR